VIYMIIRGTIHLAGDNVDTDVIIPARYLTSIDPNYIVEHLFEGVEPDFHKRITRGDILMAGKNFGSGSSREQAAMGLKAAGIYAIIAKSFARIFYRNAVNIGLPLFIAPSAIDYVHSLLKSGGAKGAGTYILSLDVGAEIDVEEGVIRIKGETFPFSPLPEFIKEIMLGGGVWPWVKSMIGKRH